MSQISSTDFLSSKPRSRKEKWILAEGGINDKMGDHWKTMVECKGLEPRAHGKHVKTTLILSAHILLSETRLLSLGLSDRLSGLLGEVNLTYSYPVLVSCPFEKLPINAEVLMKKFQEQLCVNITADKKKELIEKELEKMKLSNFNLKV